MSPKDPEHSSPDAPAPPADQLDALMTNAGDVAAGQITGDPGAEEPVQASADATPDDGTQMEPEGRVAQAVAEEPGQGMDDPLVPDADLDAPIVEDAAGMTETEPPVGGDSADLDAILGVPSKAPAKTDVESAPEVEPGDPVTSDVVSENLAAAAPAADQVETPLSEDLVQALTEEAAGDAAPSDAVPPPTLPTEEAVAPPSMDGQDTDSPPETAPKAASVSRSPMAILAANPLKTVLAVAAGLICAFATFSGLYMHRAVVPQDRAVVPQDMTPLADSTPGLEQAIQVARTESELGNHAEAMRALEEPIRQAPQGELRQEAEFLWTEAAFHTLPASPSAEQAQQVLTQINEFADTARGHPRIAEALYWKAKIHERMGDAYAARQTYTNILSNVRNVPNMDVVLFDASRLALGLGRISDAEAYAQRLTTQFPASPHAGAAKLVLADSYLERGERDAAEAILNRLVATQSHTELGAEAAARLGELALARGRNEDAIQQLEMRLQTATTTDGNERIYLQLAQAYRANGQFAEAESTLRDLIDFFPENPYTPEAYVELSQLLEVQGRRRDAIRVAEQAARRYADRPEVLRNQAALLGEDGRLVAAADALVAAQEAGGNDPDLLLDAGLLSLESKNYAAATEVFDRLVREYPGTPQAVQATVESARIQYATGRVRAAVDTLEDLLLASKHQPHYTTVLSGLAALYRDLGLRERAAELYERLAAETADPELLAQAGTAQLEAGAWDKGLAIAKRVNPDKAAPKTVYRLLVQEGRTLLRISPQMAVGKLAQAHESFPAERTVAGDRLLVEAYLATNQMPRARGVVQELAMAAQQDQLKVPALQQAANAWGDYSYRRGDHRTSVEAYALAAKAAGGEPEDRHWAEYQQANALIHVAKYDQALALYDAIAASKSAWAEDAALRAEYARLEQGLGAAGVGGAE